jgi:hypothetical protein
VRPPALSSGVRLWSSTPVATVALFTAFLLMAPPAPGQAVPGQLNTELYGRGVGAVRQSGLAALGNKPWNMGVLPSEYQHDVVLSGRLRSEIRGEYLARGPLAPGGIESYIPVSPLPYGPYGSVRPYSTNPRPVAAAPSPPDRRPSSGGRVASLPTPYTGVLRGTSATSGGSLRMPGSGVPLQAEPLPATPGVKPPLITPSYGSLRASSPTPVPLQPGLTLPPPVPTSGKASETDLSP